jgi:NTE family protein
VLDIEDLAASAPVAPQPAADKGVGLALSGGGYRAMLFHVGALWRLGELGWLPKLQRVSSVSGGSITAGQLALRWADLDFDAQGRPQNLQGVLVTPLRDLARQTIDVKAVLGGLALPFRHVSDQTQSHLRRHLFGTATLADLPANPRFTFTSTDLNSGTLWRFSRAYMGDYQVGLVNEPNLPLVAAVTASAAFPPFLSPVRLDLSDVTWSKVPDPPAAHVTPWPPDHLMLSDGGVYDNLGVQPLRGCSTLLVSDGGGHMEYSARVRRNRLSHHQRVTEVIDNQVRALRKQEVVRSYRQPGTQALKGAYWGIRADVRKYGVADPLPVDFTVTRALAATKTRMAAMPEDLQESLINWGYVVCDTAMRRWVEPHASRPGSMPYPGRSLGS